MKHLFATALLLVFFLPMLPAQLLDRWERLVNYSQVSAMPTGFGASGSGVYVATHQPFVSVDSVWIRDISPTNQLVQQWGQSFDHPTAFNIGMIQLVDGSYMAAGLLYVYPTRTMAMQKYTNSGASVWTNTYTRQNTVTYGTTNTCTSPDTFYSVNGAPKMEALIDTGFLFQQQTSWTCDSTRRYFTTIPNDNQLYRYDKNGNIVWATTGTVSFYKCFNYQDIWVARYAYGQSNNRIRLDRLDFATGAVAQTWQSALIPNGLYFKDFQWTSGGDLVVLSVEIPWATSQVINRVYRFSAQGNILWSYDLDGESATIAPNGDVLVYGAEEFAIPNSLIAGVRAVLTRLDGATGAPIWQRRYYNADLGETPKKVLNAPAGGFYLYSFDQDNSIARRVDSLGFLYDRTITGKVFRDNNTDCAYTGNTDAVWANVVVCATETTTGDRFYGFSDSLGNYEIPVPAGNYTLSAQSALVGPYWQGCSPAPVISISNGVNAQGDLPLQALAPCPLLEVGLSTNRLRWCGSGLGSYYTVHYANIGAADAYNTYVDLQLDPFLTYVSASLPSTSLGNNAYRFQLDTAEIAESGQFFVWVDVSCAAPFGHVHCSQVNIFPDTLCGLNWQGPIIEASAECDGDSLVFLLRNTGGDMTSGQQYVIIEDNIMFRQGAFQLNNGASQEIRHLADPTKAYRIEAQQAPNFPALLGDSIAWANITGCQITGAPLAANTAIWLQYYNNSCNPLIEYNCTQNRGSYDPNMKEATQIGYGVDHLIAKNTPLTYTIHFQNTGTDTAYDIVVVDTISPFLDPMTIEPQGSSHPYTMELVGNGVARFNFANIYLVDSFTNEPLSHGFVSFKISQKPNNPNGTRIENTGAIYFDNNPPIFTNTTFHTIGEAFLEVVSVQTLNNESAVQVTVAPNPMAETATLTISGARCQEWRLEVLDLAGRQVLQAQQPQNQFAIERADLVAGMYLFRVYGDGKLLHTGKLIAR